MNLYVSCSTCREKIYLPYTATDRAALSRRHGAALEISCPGCGRLQCYRANAIRATRDRSLLWFTLIILLPATGFLFYFFGEYLFSPEHPWAVVHVAGVLSIPFLIFLLLRNEEDKRITQFNTYYTTE